MAETAVSRSQVYGNMRSSGELALALRENHPEIVSSYGLNTTHAEIIERYGLLEKFRGRTYEDLANAISILIGGRKAYEFADGRYFPEIPGEIKDKKILHNLANSPQKMSRAGRASALSRGYKPWIEHGTQVNGVCYIGEKEMAIALSHLPAYQRGSQINNGKIAETLNIWYHGGSIVRTNSAVSGVLFYHRSKRKV